MGAKRAGGTARLTVFGAVVMRLMLRRGLQRWTELAECLNETRDEGERFAYNSVLNWVYGRHAVNREFPLAMIERLALASEEVSDLAIAFLMGQAVPAGSEEARENEVLKRVA